MKSFYLGWAILAVSAAAPAAEPEWADLFDGRTLAGWENTAGYEVRGGVLVCTRQGRHLSSAKEYGDFEMEFEFKLTPGANNGIGIRTAPAGDPAYTGMEIQVLDDTAAEYASLHDYQYHGSIYGVAAAKRGHLKPVGEWNRERIIALGPYVRVELNGVVITEAWLDRVQPPDGKEHPGLRREAGRIVLCGHNREVAFRNMRIRDFTLPAAAGAPEGAPPPGFVPLFNGRDLDGWRGLAAEPPQRAKMSDEEYAGAQRQADQNMRAHWTAGDGILCFDGRGKSLCTARDYANFDLFVDWKIRPGVDSGIYLRGTPQVQIWDTADVRGHGQEKGSGGLWNNRGEGKWPETKADRPTGEWNRFLIRMVGDRVTVYLNGIRVVNGAPLDPYWDRSAPLPATGSIELQSHGTPIEFRNIHLRELPR